MEDRRGASPSGICTRSLRDGPDGVTTRRPGGLEWLGFCRKFSAKKRTNGKFGRAPQRSTCRPRCISAGLSISRWPPSPGFIAQTEPATRKTVHWPRMQCRVARHTGNDLLCCPLCVGVPSSGDRRASLFINSLYSCRSGWPQPASSAPPGIDLAKRKSHNPDQQPRQFRRIRDEHHSSPVPLGAPQLHLRVILGPRNRTASPFSNRATNGIGLWASPRSDGISVRGCRFGTRPGA